MPTETPTGGRLISDEALAFKTENAGTYTYFGEAPPGAAAADPVWRISRMTNSDSTIEWADGDAEFDNVWSNRASLSYS